jgi:hypothetical protein
MWQAPPNASFPNQPFASHQSKRLSKIEKKNSNKQYTKREFIVIP